MGIFDRVRRLLRTDINDIFNDLFSKTAEDPEKVLDQAIIDMQEDLVKLRQAVAQAIATHKRTEQKYNNNLAEAHKWQQRGEQASNKGDENLAKECSLRQKSYQDIANEMEQELARQSGQTEELKRNLIALESQISQAKTKKDMLKARASAARATQELHDILKDINSSGPLAAAFKSMEDKVLAMEAAAQTTSDVAASGTAEDPEMVVEQGIIDMQSHLVKLRQTVAQANATHKRMEQEYNNNLAEAHKWQQRGEQASNKGDENLAKECSLRQKSYQDIANEMEQQLHRQSPQTEQLKRNLIALESQISQAKTKKDMLKARGSAAKATQELHKILSDINKPEDSQKVLDQGIVTLRQAVAQASVTQKRSEQEYKKNLAEAHKWQQRGEQASNKGDKNLAKECSLRQKSYQDIANEMKQQLDIISGQTEKLKSNLIALESKISAVKTTKERL